MPTKTREHLLLQLLKLVAVKPFRPLTVAEERVANLCAEGLGYKQIGHRLSMSPRTVQHHVNAIADILPDDGLPARERVQMWAVCAALPELAKRFVLSETT
jgi:DNA-binding NarL/FixJ family response regulator